LGSFVFTLYIIRKKKRKEKACVPYGGRFIASRGAQQKVNNSTARIQKPLCQKGPVAPNYPLILYNLGEVVKRVGIFLLLFLFLFIF
jgi:hypothetical protein